MSSNNGGQGPWGSPGGSGGGGRRPGGGGPWGQGGGPFNQRPGGPGPLPDLDALIARLQAFVRSLLGGGPRGRFTGGRGLTLLGLAVVVLWLLSGFYRVETDEVGVVLRFGAFSKLTGPGLNYHLPWPIEHAITPPVTRINRIEIGFQSLGAVQSDTGVLHSPSRFGQYTAFAIASTLPSR